MYFEVLILSFFDGRLSGDDDDEDDVVVLLLGRAAAARRVRSFCARLFFPLFLASTACDGLLTEGRKEERTD